MSQSFDSGHDGWSTCTLFYSRTVQLEREEGEVEERVKLPTSLLKFYSSMHIFTFVHPSLAKIILRSQIPVHLKQNGRK